LRRGVDDDHSTITGENNSRTNRHWVTATASIYNHFATRSRLRLGDQQQCVFVSDQIPLPPYACRYAPRHPIPQDYPRHRCAQAFLARF
jgi:hypothetical protein